MKTSYLLPNRFKKIGWILFIPGLILGCFVIFMGWEPDWFNLSTFAVVDSFLSDPTYFGMIENEVTDEIAGLLIIIGAIFIAFSKEKNEDEFISQLRLQSLVWATYLNYFILIFAILFVYGMSFFWVLVFNMFTILIFFIIRFNLALTKAKKMIGNEE